MKAAGTPAQSGGFITGADAIDAIAYAIKQSGGSTDGAKLAAVLSHLTKFQTLGGPITFTPTFHSVTGTALPRHRGEQQRRQGDRRAHHEGHRQHPLSELAGGTTEGQASHGGARPDPRPGSLRALGVSRSFEGIHALQDVDLELAPGRGARADRPQRGREDDARQPPDRLRPADVGADRARRDRDHALAAASPRPGGARAHVPAREALSRADGPRERRGRGSGLRRLSGGGAPARRPSCSACSGWSPGRRIRPRSSPTATNGGSASRGRSRCAPGSC